MPNVGSDCRSEDELLVLRQAQDERALGQAQGERGEVVSGGDAPLRQPFRLPPPPGGEILSEFADDPVLTPERKLRFLDCLAQHGNVRVAAARVGVSRSGLYLARRRDLRFADGWRAALCRARDHAEAVLAERALDGVEEQVFYHGEVIATRRRFDTRLLLAHLARLDALCAERRGAEPFDLALARVAGIEAATPPANRDGHLETVAKHAGRDFDASAPPSEPEEPWTFDPLDDDPDDDGSIYAAERERRHEARFEAELRYEAERQDFIAAEVGRAADQLDSGQTQMFAAIDALRLTPPFEVKSLAPPLFGFRTVSTVSSRSGLSPPLPVALWRVSHGGSGESRGG